MKIFFLTLLFISSSAFAELCPNSFVISDLVIKKYKNDGSAVNLTQNFAAYEMENLQSATYTKVQEYGDECLYLSGSSKSKARFFFYEAGTSILIDSAFRPEVQDGWGNHMDLATLEGAFGAMRFFPGSVLDLTDFRLNVRYEKTQWWRTDFLSFNKPFTGQIEFGEE